MMINFGKNSTFEVIDCEGKLYYQGQIKNFPLSRTRLMDFIISELETDYKFRVGDEVWIAHEYGSLGSDYGIIEGFSGRRNAVVRITRDDSGGNLEGRIFQIPFFYLNKFYRDETTN